MEKYYKISITLFLFVFISVSLQNVASAKTKIQSVSPTDNWAMSLSEIEELIGQRSDGKVKISGPTENTTFKTKDKITVTWKYSGMSNSETGLVLINEDLLLPVDMILIDPDQTSYSFVVKDEFPTGKYFITIIEPSSESTFDITKSFKLKTKISQKETERLYEDNISDARGKASDAAAKANLSNARVYAELYYDTNGGYADVCKKSGEGESGVKTSVDAAKKSTGKKADCDSTAKAWAAEVQLKNSKAYFCVDSIGFAKDQKKSKGSKSTACEKSTNKISKDANSNIHKVTSKDHFLSGDMKSQVKVVTYTDLECPFCKGFDATVRELIDNYGDKVAFVYRHYPLTQIHKNAELAANASECVAKLGNKNTFSTFIHKVFMDSPDSLEKSALSTIATTLGIQKRSFDSCLAKKTYSKEIKQDQALGNKIAQSDSQFGTPHSLVFGSDGSVTTVRGNQPYADVKEIIENLLW